MNKYNLNELNINLYDNDINKTGVSKDLSNVIPHYYRFGIRNFRLNIPSDMKYPENLSKFEFSSLDELFSEKEGNNDKSGEVFCCTEYDFEFTENISEIVEFLKAKQVPGRVVKRDNLYLFPTQTGECRFICHYFNPVPFAISWQTAENSYRVWISKAENDNLIYDPVFLSCLSLERHMIKDDALILHSAYMLYKGKAVLFSAPSETGKSTQASLWEKYRHTRTVNGDRSLLMKQDGLWSAHGWPICGSSEICFNESYPIHAIVMLKQAKENKVYPLKGVAALKEIMSQITINSWDSAFQIRALDQIEKLISEVPVYKLECDISEGAVECLEKVIQI